MRLLAYAKLNLLLRVGEKRQEDGLHNLRSVVQTVDLADRIEVTLHDGHGVRFTSTLDLPAEHDLAYQAAQKVLQEKNDSTGIAVSVQKQIPVGAGLGGGSSNAATVLWAVNRLTPPGLPDGRLHHLAAELGSDIPLFLVGGCAEVSGCGERVVRWDSKGYDRFLLILPPIQCHTAAVYHQLDKQRCFPRNEVDAVGINDLEPPAMALYPELATYRDAVSNLGDIRGMTGSGAAYFVGFRGSPDPTRRVDDLHRSLSKRLPDCRILLCTSTDAGFRVTRG